MHEVFKAICRDTSAPMINCPDVIESIRSDRKYAHLIGKGGVAFAKTLSLNANLKRTDDLMLRLQPCDTRSLFGKPKLPLVKF